MQEELSQAQNEANDGHRLPEARCQIFYAIFTCESEGSKTRQKRATVKLSALKKKKKKICCISLYFSVCFFANGMYGFSHRHALHVCTVASLSFSHNMTKP